MDVRSRRLRVACTSFQVFDLGLINPAVASHWPHLNFAMPYTLWAGIIGGAFLTTASHGTDQLIVQRLLASRSQRQSVLALLSSGVAVFFQFTLFLFVGVMLFVYYRFPLPPLDAPIASTQHLS